MITKGIIQSIDFNGNTCTVRLPYFETAGNDEIILEAPVSNTPGSYNGYKENDVVWVAFENGHMETPVIVGKLYLGAEKEKADPRGVSNVESAAVSKTASMPFDTTLSNDVPDGMPNTVAPYGSLKSVARALSDVNTNLGSFQRQVNNKFSSVITDKSELEAEWRSEIQQSANTINARVTEIKKETDDKIDDVAEDLDGKLDAVSEPEVTSFGWQLTSNEWAVLSCTSNKTSAIYNAKLSVRNSVLCINNRATEIETESTEGYTVDIVQDSVVTTKYYWAVTNTTTSTTVTTKLLAGYYDSTLEYVLFEQPILIADKEGLKVSGTIDATDGHIGSFIIGKEHSCTEISGTASGIYSDGYKDKDGEQITSFEQDPATDATGVYVGTDGIRVGDKFSVDTKGTVNAKGLNITLSDDNVKDLTPVTTNKYIISDQGTTIPAEDAKDYRNPDLSWREEYPTNAQKGDYVWKWTLATYAKAETKNTSSYSCEYIAQDGAEGQPGTDGTSVPYITCYSNVNELNGCGVECNGTVLYESNSQGNDINGTWIILFDPTEQAVKSAAAYVTDDTYESQWQDLWTNTTFEDDLYILSTSHDVYAGVDVTDPAFEIATNTPQKEFSYEEYSKYIIIILTCGSNSLTETARNYINKLGGYCLDHWGDDINQQILIGSYGLSSGEGYEQSGTSEDYIQMAYFSESGIVKNGAKGNGIKTTIIDYAYSDSGITPPATGWKTELEVNPGQYMWTRTRATYDNGTTTTSYSVSYQGKDGESGQSAGTNLLENSENYPASGAWNRTIGGYDSTTFITWSDGYYFCGEKTTETPLWRKPKLVVYMVKDRTYTVQCDMSGTWITGTGSCYSNQQYQRIWLVNYVESAEYGSDLSSIYRFGNNDCAYGSSGGLSQISYTETGTTIARHTWTFTAQASGYYIIRIDTFQTVDFWNLMVEENDSPSAWAPPGKDVTWSSCIAALGIPSTATANKGIYTGTGSESNKTLFINADAIQTGAILVGDATKPRFYAKIDDATVTIGGFNVNDTSIYKIANTDDTPGTASSLFMSTGATSTNDIGGSGSGTSRTWAFTANSSFGVTTGGALYSTSGKIGGFNIGTASISSGTIGNTSSVLISTGTSSSKSIGGSSGTKTWAFTSGAAFGVTTDGVLYSASAEFSSSITANGGVQTTSICATGEIEASTSISCSKKINTNNYYLSSTKLLDVGTTGGKSVTITATVSQTSSSSDVITITLDQSVSTDTDWTVYRKCTFGGSTVQGSTIITVLAGTTTRSKSLSIGPYGGTYAAPSFNADTTVTTSTQSVTSVTTKWACFEMPIWTESNTHFGTGTHDYWGTNNFNGNVTKIHELYTPSTSSTHAYSTYLDNQGIHSYDENGYGTSYAYWWNLPFTPTVVTDPTATTAGRLAHCRITYGSVSVGSGSTSTINFKSTSTIVSAVASAETAKNYAAGAVFNNTAHTVTLWNNGSSSYINYIVIYYDSSDETTWNIHA